MELGRALTFVFRDPRWVRKLGIAVLLGLPSAALGLLFSERFGDVLLAGGVLPTLLGLLPSLLSVPLLGYALRVARNAAAGTDLPLPEWDDPGGLLRDGLKAWGVVTLWTFPVLLAGLVGDFPPGMAEGRGVTTPLVLAVLATLLLSVVEPAAETRLAVSGSFVAGLDVAAAFRTVGRNLGGYVLIVLVFVAGAAVAGGVGAGVLLLAWITAGGQPDTLDAIGLGGAIVTTLFGPYGRLVLYHLYGQAYRQANGRPPSAPPRDDQVGRW